MQKVNGVFFGPLCDRSGGQRLGDECKNDAIMSQKMRGVMGTSQGQRSHPHAHSRIWCAVGCFPIGCQWLIPQWSDGQNPMPTQWP